MTRIGAHVSAAGGLYNAFAHARAIGAECMQIFGSSPRQWAVRYPDKIIAAKFRALAKTSGVRPIFLHAPYLASLATPNKFIRSQSIKSLIGHLRIAEMLGATGLIFHLGSAKTSTVEEAVKATVAGMQEVLRAVPGKTLLIMENSSGGGNKLGKDVAGIAHILKKVRSPRVKVCFDTAHAFQSGMIPDYTPKNIRKFFDLWDKEIGVKNIVVVHANDSKTAAGSNHDRHENIGKGYLGLRSFRKLAREARLAGQPWILEVPGFSDEGPDRKNIELLRSCLKG
ncbi:MAG: deoxyribonuclease IV [Candidatus Doudnabacteria bacterium]|nr:deoxyribonuclease IV [Candidatus Doudnabacteria bacterium]